MSGIALKGSATGSSNVEVVAPVTNTALTYDLPKHGGKVAAFGAPAAVSATGTSVDFINGSGDVVIPDEARRITVLFQGVSTNGTSDVQVQLGDSGGIENSGYLGSSAGGNNGVASVAMSSGFNTNSPGSAAAAMYGLMHISKITGNVWVCSFSFGATGTARFAAGGGAKELSGTLDRLRITTVNGTDTFDAGTVAILVE